VVVSLLAAHAEAQQHVQEEEGEHNESGDIGDLEPFLDMTLDVSCAVHFGIRLVLHVAEDVERNEISDTRAFELRLKQLHDDCNSVPLAIVNVVVNSATQSICLSIIDSRISQPF